MSGGICALELVFDFARLDRVLSGELQCYVELLEQVDEVLRVCSCAPGREVGDDDLRE